MISGAGNFLLNTSCFDNPPKFFRLQCCLAHSTVRHFNSGCLGNWRYGCVAFQGRQLFSFVGHMLTLDLWNPNSSSIFWRVIVWPWEIASRVHWKILACPIHENGWDPCLKGFWAHWRDRYFHIYIYVKLRKDGTLTLESTWLSRSCTHTYLTRTSVPVPGRDNFSDAIWVLGSVAWDRWDQLIWGLGAGVVERWRLGNKHPSPPSRAFPAVGCQVWRWCAGNRATCRAEAASEGWENPTHVGKREPYRDDLSQRPVTSPHPHRVGESPKRTWP